MIGSFIKWIWHGKSGASAALQTVIFRFVIIGLNLATGVITARYLGPEGRGELAAIILWPQLLGIILALGLESALLYRIQKAPEEKSKLFTAAITLGFLQSLIAVAIGLIFIPKWMSGYTTDTAKIAQMFTLFSPLIICGQIFLGAYKADNSFSTINRIRTISPFSQMVLLIGLVILGEAQPLNAALAYLLPSAFSFSWQLWDLSKTYSLNFSNIWKSINSLFGYSSRSAGITILKQLETRLDQIFVIGYLSPEMMGLYVIGLNSSRLLRMIQGSLSEILFPKIAARPLEEILEITEHTARISLFLVIIIALPLMLTAPIIIPLVYGNEFSSSINIFRMLCTKMILDGTTILLSQAFMAAGKPGVIAVLQLVGLIITIPLMMFFVPNHGLSGVCIALLISAVSRFLLVIFSYPVVLHQQMPNLMISKSDILFARSRFSFR